MGKKISVDRMLMGSPFNICTYDDIKDEQTTLYLLDSAFTEVKRLEDLMTDFRDSPLNDINKNAGIKPVKVPEELFHIIETSLELSRESKGAFDISYAAVGQLWREAFKTKVLPKKEELEELKKHVDYKKIILNKEKLEVFLPDPKMRIGLGGVGKGYAVDAVFRYLKEMGFNNFYVNGAGDIRVCSDAKAPRKWRIAIKNPFSTEGLAAGYTEIANGAVATSGDYERFVEIDGKKYHHIMDARTSKISDAIVSVSIFSNSALTSDLFATTVMALGIEDGINFLNSRKNIFGVIIDSKGKVYRSYETKSMEGLNVQC